MPFLELISTVLKLYYWIVIIGVILSWLLMFGVINGRNEVVQAINRFCNSVTEPVLRRLRRHIQPINGFDLTPLILILGILLIDRCLWWYVAPMLVRSGL
jgi:YggT family protein